MFSNGSHFQIAGGQFINVGGDFNLENGQAALNVPGMLSALDFGRGQSSDRLLGGADRTERGGGHRPLPYDTSHRRRIMAPPNDTDTRDSGPTLTSIFYSPSYIQDAMNAGGDFNFDNAQAAPNVPDIFSALDFGPGWDSGRLLGGAESAKTGGGPPAGALPYDISQRRRITAPPEDTDTLDSGSILTSYLSAPPHGQDPLNAGYSPL
ncbi:hypothetical protein B0H11DRAFT_205627 [Mycena galericulata]|nr:hypothetical protein B0H11DRAFT_205627 [Mycena galericulata]